LSLKESIDHNEMKIGDNLFDVEGIESKKECLDEEMPKRKRKRKNKNKSKKESVCIVQCQSHKVLMVKYKTDLCKNWLERGWCH